MCRFVLYLGPDITLDVLITKPQHSIIHQSFHSEEREEPLNGDGFGVAWYVPDLAPEPALFRSVSPAWSNTNLRHLARVTRSGCILVHIRAASPGLPVTQLNCHPFALGPLSFMHNGTIGGFHLIKRAMQQRLSEEAFDHLQGSTDSEHFFVLFFDRYRQSTEADPAERLAGAMAASIEEVESMRRAAGTREPSLLNMAVTDGSVAVATRYASSGALGANSLYIHRGRRYTCEGGICRMIEPEAGAGSVLIASEPLSRDPGWTPMAVNQMAIVGKGGSIQMRPIG